MKYYIYKHSKQNTLLALEELKINWYKLTPLSYKQRNQKIKR